MKIESLQRLDQRTASGILAGLALGTSTNPGVGTAAAFSRDFDSQAIQVLAEIRQFLKLREDDHSLAAETRVSNALSLALSEVLLEGKDRKAISARAGNKGRLPPSMYTIQLGRWFTQNFREFGVRESHVRETITSSDDYQHLMTEDVDKNIDLFSLFVKWHSNKVEKDSYWSIASTIRKGDILEVQHFWRVYPDVVDLTGADKPADMLAAFCNKFGRDVVVGDTTAKFILQNRLPAKLGPMAQVTWKYMNSSSSIISLTPDRVISTLSVRKESENTFVDVGIAYAIDVAMYRDSLLRHGVIIL